MRRNTCVSRRLHAIEMARRTDLRVGPHDDPQQISLPLHHDPQHDGRRVALGHHAHVLALAYAECLAQSPCHCRTLVFWNHEFLHSFKNCCAPSLSNSPRLRFPVAIDPVAIDQITRNAHAPITAAQCRSQFACKRMSRKRSFDAPMLDPTRRPTRNLVLFLVI